MKTGISYEEAKQILLSLTEPVRTEGIDLDQSYGRIISEDIIALESVPSFDRSPYDGYAVRACDTVQADQEPVDFIITEYIPAGYHPVKSIHQGEAARIMTGGEIPRGADAVIMQEKVTEGDGIVTISNRLSPGENIIFAGEDVRAGEILASKGTVIDPGLAGAMAAQGITSPQVFKQPVIGLISVGNELVEPGDLASGPLIRDTNRIILTSAILRNGCIPRFIGTAKDDVDNIADLLEKGLKYCDMVLLTGGFSVGDLDLTPKAMQNIGCRLLVSGVRIKPGMACCYGTAGDKLICGLSGNPAAAFTNFCVVILPVLRKLAGQYPFETVTFPITLANSFPKASGSTRILRGTLDISDGTCRMKISENQGNIVIRSTIGCDVMAEIPSGSGPLEAGTVLKGFLI
ncbi:MAG: molybdopterin molybdotransferase MoeA [Firmicutes bacterium]|nr:molybdopterin molybdotransferase MoeA [Bacillota bacterium]